MVRHAASQQDSARIIANWGLKVPMYFTTKSKLACSQRRPNCCRTAVDRAQYSHCNVWVFGLMTGGVYFHLWVLVVPARVLIHM